MKHVIKAIEKYIEEGQLIAARSKEVQIEIAADLRRERERNGVTLRAMAKQLGISAAYLSDIELGRRNLSSTMLEKLRRLEKQK